MNATPASLFEVSGMSVSPTSLARGPWGGDTLHGGPVAGILARAVQRDVRTGTGPGRALVRLTIDLLRPAPLAEMRLRVDVLREGAQTRVSRVELIHEDAVVAAASALEVTRSNVPIPDEGHPPEPHLQPPVETSAPPIGPGEVTFHTHAIDLRVVEGSYDIPGPATSWCRLRVPLVSGEVTTPAQCAAVIADLCGLGVVLPTDRYSMRNTDVDLRLHRDPEGDWIRTVCTSQVGAEGAGHNRGALSDLAGTFGQSMQAIVIKRRD